jgi:enamine deaminase RidA (YjgF/YER057c/UK114 family)
MRQRVSSGAPWEPIVGYSRAVRVANHVHVSGTVSVDADGAVVGPGDPYAQAKHILEKIRTVLAEVGASFGDVIRTRMFVTDISRWEDIGRAHGEVFADIRPVTTMVEVSQLISPELLVEIEVEAIVE